MFQLTEFALARYARMRDEAKADPCTVCGECVEKCTTRLDIPEELKQAHELLSA